MSVQPALTDSLGRRWAWCRRCHTPHGLGTFPLRFCDEVTVPWACPHPRAPAAIRVREPEAWFLFYDEKE